jgi:hypothetical protein
MFFFGGQELRQGFPSTPEFTSNHFLNLNCEGVGGRRDLGLEVQAQTGGGRRVHTRSRILCDSAFVLLKSKRRNSPLLKDSSCSRLILGGGALFDSGALFDGVVRRRCSLGGGIVGDGIFFSAAVLIPSGRGYGQNRGVKTVDLISRGAVVGT